MSARIWCDRCGGKLPLHSWRLAADPRRFCSEECARNDGEVSRLIYLIGSLRNPRITEVARQLRDEGLDVFDDWHAAGPDADDEWQRYEKDRGRSFAEALDGAHARCVFDFDRFHLSQSYAAVLVAPAGKSAHLELGWMLGQGKPGYVLLDGEPERYDVMYRFATGVFTDLDALIKELR